MAKLNAKRLIEILSEATEILGSFREAAAAEIAARDNPPPTEGTPRAPGAQDSGDVWSRGVHGVKSKNLTYVGGDPAKAANAARSLEALIPGYNRLRENTGWKPTPQVDLFKK